MKPITYLLIILLLPCISCSDSSRGIRTDAYELELWYENNFSENQTIIRETDLLDSTLSVRTKEPALATEWVIEGEGDAKIMDGKLWVSPVPFTEGIEQKAVPDDMRSHMVVWCNRVFPSNFLIEFTVNHHGSDNGLTLVFFCATGINGEDIFDITLPPRFADYINYHSKSIANYTDSYWSRNRGILADERFTNRLRKNPGFKQIAESESNTSDISDTDIKIRILKYNDLIEIEVNGLKVMTVKDTAEPLGAGKFGFRSMAPVKIVTYSNMKVWEVKGTRNN